MTSREGWTTKGYRKEEGREVVETERGRGRERKGVCSEGGGRMGRIDLSYAKRAKEDAVHRTKRRRKIARVESAS